ncbi:NAD(P)/FAD-dependent oxidoreductase [Nocardioides sp. zg-DK7169]|uniref:NAD(P)/FAD-dependent oxidoreductase n=1 Tax=Nocardioides sp. zg-DK7169 TaxID=2736600 RepID=UPI00155331C0|nr:NAD(P)/FAD-dependent oxidoreductase [Nocardioides sp. zg-DK7169]NPC97020.1 NAD(P)/FAD-dependent oxidoreductase [Nocardioides sp. zg-DK7169]
MTDPLPVPEHDVVVVGGGAAALSGALALGRSLRSVLVLDAGEPRNAPAAHAHNYLGREGVPPRELLAIGRAEVEQYGVEVVAARVAEVRRDGDPDSPDPHGTGFTVATEDGRTVRARRVLVATGLVDVLPDVPGLAARWGRDVLHCPYCHGWEVRGQRVVVLATGPMATHQALLFGQLTEHVVVVVADPAAHPAEADLERLAARGIAVLDDPPLEVLTTDDALSGVRLASGELLACDAVVVSPRVEAQAGFLAPLGLGAEPFAPGGVELGTALPADPMGATAVPGLWAAGNVTDPMAQVIASAAAGLRVGAMINADLVEEETRAAVAARRALA